MSATQPAPKIALNEVLVSHCAFGGGRAEIRLAPFFVDLAPDARPVWRLVFEAPEFASDRPRPSRS